MKPTNMTENLDLKFRWEWYDSSDSKWKVYSNEFQNLLNDSINNKKTKAELIVKNVKYELTFDGKKSCQKNFKSKYERPIRFCLLDENDNDENADKKERWAFWERLDENKNWIAYSPYTSIELESHFQKYISNNETKINSVVKIALKESKNNYLVDLKKMEQVNARTKYSRKVKREMSDATNIRQEDTAAAKPTNKRKRKGLTYAASTTSTISLKSDPEDDENIDTHAANTKSDGKRLKKVREQIAITTGATNHVQVKDEKVEVDDEETPAQVIGKRKTSVKEENEVNDEEPVSNTSKSSGKRQKKEEHEDEEKTGKKGKSARAVNKEKSGKSATKENEEEEIIKTCKFSGDVPLDEKFIEFHGSNYKIYKEDNIYYDTMLNQANLQFNNNKYYLIQLIEQGTSGGGKNYLVWMRWGRVGKAGQNSRENCGGNLARAKEIFCRKFLDKTSNDWADKDQFEKVPGKYDLVHKDYASDETQAALREDAESQSNERSASKIPPSKLDKRIQDLVELVCNVTEMENVLKEMKYDAKKAPLGKLSKSQIKAGYEALSELEELIKSKASSNKLVQANNDFYTRIPHDFGMRPPQMITTQVQIREKMKLLEVLGDIEIAIKILNQKSDIENPIDRHYDQLECDLNPLDHSDSMFKLIEKYMTNTHAVTHNNYSLKLIDVFEAKKAVEQDRFQDFGNRMLLWHGSRMTNWASILMQGLRIAPPEAPVTGYMFGKGCYFADCASKAANYCYTTSNKNVGFLSLSEVSLGTCNELKQADYNADQLPAGKNSTKGEGRSEPNRKDWVTLADGTVVPCGKLVSVVDRTNATSYALLYNEYIVYNLEQIKLRYVAKVEFVYED